MIDVADMLAGGGGTTTGAKMAGARVRFAINHNAEAVDVHRRNHPEVEHYCEDACLFDYGRWRGLDGILASIACQGFSPAATNCGGGPRGSLPKHDKDRATAHAVTHALELTRVPFAIVECTVGLASWWELYRSWCEMLRALGYQLAEHVIDAADFGAPAARSRLYVTAVRGRSPLVLRLPPRQRVGVGACFDAALTGWLPVSKLPPDARRRIARARKRHRGLMAVRYTSTDIGRGLDEIAPTITTKNQCAWVRPGRRGDERRMWRSHEYAAALGFPPDYKLTGKVNTDCRLIGNAVSPLVMRAIVEEVIARG